VRKFVPIVNNPHALTILGNFWPRELDFSLYPSTRKLYRTEPDVEVLVDSQSPQNPIAELVMVHGLEGAGEAGYIRTLAHHALTHNFATHRFHMRTCGGTEHLCNTLYHGGLTSDLLSYLKQLNTTKPVFLTGFSLGGNVVLKLAGELGAEAQQLLAGVCAVSAPIDLAMAAHQINAPVNFVYQRRFVTRMRARLAATGRYPPGQLAKLHTLYEIDDKITAPSFGFATADRYYATQSSNRFLADIRIPTLLIAAQDDPLIPFRMYREAQPERNPHITAIYPEHGGHIGFLARQKPRFWADETIVRWALEHCSAGFTTI
jgi:predicted alpha/beta-fold hydrolase